MYFTNEKCVLDICKMWLEKEEYFHIITRGRSEYFSNYYLCGYWWILWYCSRYYFFFIHFRKYEIENVTITCEIVPRHVIPEISGLHFILTLLKTIISICELVKWSLCKFVTNQALYRENWRKLIINYGLHACITSGCL